MNRLEEKAGLIFSMITSLLFCGAAFGVAQTQINHNKEALRQVEEDTTYFYK